MLAGFAGFLRLPVMMILPAIPCCYWLCVHVLFVNYKATVVYFARFAVISAVMFAPGREALV